MARPRLTGRLDAAPRLTLLSAPAGFGKSTLLSAWLATDARRGSVAWLSLDESDNRPAVFWTYVIAALQRVVPGLGDGALPLLQAPRPPLEGVLATLVNELAAAPGEVDLVLDDYHLVEDGAVHAGMAFLLDHLPPRVRVVISTRADPPLPLARLRARGDLVELRAADLRFTVEEAAAYLNEVAGLGLSASDVATLEARTEGWAAALQLAALSMRGREDVAGFIAGFAGDDRYVVDYLAEEVLAGQPGPVRDFLVRTSILDRLSGPLCDAVTGGSGGKAMLETLDRANLFVVRLDDNRRWYRYHHLFADVLYTRLLDEQPDQVAGLHLRASEWYDRNGQPSPAIRHALAAGDVERAAGLVELAIPALRRDRQEATIRAWLGAIPDDVLRARPVLSVGLAGAMVAAGEFDGVEARLAEAERLDSPVVLDRDGFARLPADIRLYRAAMALARGDIPATLRYAERAIAHARGHHLTQAAAAGLRGLALWGTGDLEGAHDAYEICVDGLKRAGHVSDVLGCSVTLADLSLTRGRLREAAGTYERGLRLASGETRGVADMHVGLGQVALERNDLEEAARHLHRGRELGDRAGLPQNPYRWRVAMARLAEVQGDPEAALGHFDEAERVYAGDFSPDVRPIAALRARMLAAHGRVAEALRWARERGLTAEDELSYLREFEHMTLARVLLAAGRTDEAGRLLRRLSEAAEAGGRTGNLVEILVLRALAGGGSEPLERAWTLAEPEGCARVFLDAGYPALSAASSASSPDLSPAVSPASPAVSPASLVDPLSARELDVLRLLATDLDGPDIARHLSVSLNTLRTHTRNIYAKLGVNSRRAAVTQAGRLGLL